MNGAFLGHFHELGTLLGCERAGQRDFEMNPIEHAFLRFALLAIFCVNAGMAHRDGDAVERPFLSPCVEADRHGGAGTQSGQEIVVRIGGGGGAADADRLVRADVMRANGDVLQEIARVTAHDNVGRLQAGAGGVHVLD